MNSSIWKLASVTLVLAICAFDWNPGLAQEQAFNGTYSMPFKVPRPQITLAPPRVDRDAIRFQIEVLEKPGIVTVEFLSSACMACNPVSKQLDSLTAPYGDTVRIFRIEANENTGLCSEFGVKRVPTVLLFKDGRVVDQFPQFSERQSELLTQAIRHQL